MPGQLPCPTRPKRGWPVSSGKTMVQPSKWTPQGLILATFANGTLWQTTFFVHSECQDGQTNVRPNNCALL